MNRRIRTILVLLGCVAGQLAGSLTGWAQQPTAPPPAAPTDVLLLTTGAELSGRVVSITPTELAYLPAPAVGAPLRTDTLRLPAASVFLVRYANGTRELLADILALEVPDATPLALRGLSAAQRQTLGQRDALQHYRASGSYWGAMGATLYLGPLLGIASTAGLSARAVRPRNLHAPQPALLADANYSLGYRQQANKTKRRRAWSGYGVATAAYLLLIGVVLTSGQ